MVLAGVLLVVAVTAIVVVVRLLARVIRDINKWDRRSGGWRQ